MMVRAGLNTATVAWAAAAPIITPHDLVGAGAGFVFAAIGSMLPDLDHRSSTAGRLLGRRTQRLIRIVAGGHRMGTHSLLGVYLGWWLTRFVLDSPRGDTLADALAVGILAHMWCDLLTVDGIGLFYPFWRAKTRVGWMTTGTVHEERYIFAVRSVGIAVVAVYVVMWAPAAQTWLETTLGGTA